MNDRAGITSTSNSSHEEMKQTALKRDKEQVQAIVNHLNETMTDPFDIEAHPPCGIFLQACMLPEKYRIICCLLSTKVKKSAETLLTVLSL
jgi:hypothetical protein